MPTRKYTKRLPQSAYADRARKGAEGLHSIKTLVLRLVDREDELTPELCALLRPVVDGGASE